MKKRDFILLTAASLLATGVFLVSCDRRDASSAKARHVVDIVARDFTFEVANEIPSGWTTFRLRNEGMMIHFFLLTLLPEGVAFSDYVQDVGGAFGKAWNALRTGSVDKAGAGQILGESLPPWFASARAMGGVGLIGGGKATETTLKLVPGTYVMECYVKTAEGQFHTELGMIRPITVTSDLSPATEPEPDLSITVSNSALEVSGTPTRGSHLVAVHFLEHPPYGLGNDIHLARLAPATRLETVSEWLDWMNPTGLQPPAPAEFLGGAQEMPVGYTAYFHVELTPGRYAWISESSPPRGLVREFTVE